MGEVDGGSLEHSAIYRSCSIGANNHADAACARANEGGKGLRQMQLRLRLLPLFAFNRQPDPALARSCRPELRCRLPPRDK
jgi:hypothetical protein